MTDARDRNVYILGAGFSAPAGLPLVYDFIDRARIYFDDPSARINGEEREHFARFLKFKQKMSQAREKVRIDLDNVEQLFGLVEISQRLGLESPETRDSTVYVIAKTLELAARAKRASIGFIANNAAFIKMSSSMPGGFRIHSPTTPPTFAADMYDYFATLSSGLLDSPDRRGSMRNTFITFNYDLVLDDALRKVGALSDYHLPKALTHYEGEEPSSPTCSLLKIHGSTNWGVCANPACGHQVIVLDKKVTSSPAEFRSRVCLKCSQTAFQPLLIPPSWDKSEYREIMRPIWSKAVEELKLASRICVIGYSMPEADSFFKYLLTLALSENHNLYKFIVVDRNPQIAAKYEALLDPTFRERRLSIFGDEVGFEAFLGNGGSLMALGRGELVGSNLSRY